VFFIRLLYIKPLNELTGKLNLKRDSMDVKNVYWNFSLTDFIENFIEGGIVSSTTF
jgi:hypothetical protein